MAESTLTNTMTKLPSINIPGSDFLRGALGMPWLRQIILLFAIGIAVAFAVAAVLWMRSPEYRPLTGMVSGYQASEIVEMLDGQGIKYKLDDRNGEVLVSANQFHEARMMLAGSGMIGPDQSGYELLDKDQGFAVSQFAEVTRHRRSLEGELARSIGTITSVQNARVLLALPKSTTFLRDQRKPRASVTLNVLPGRSLSQDQIRGITNLVSGAVSELAPEDVAVIDQSGKLLSSEVADPVFEMRERQLQYADRIERQLHDKITGILEPTLGISGFSAAVTAEIDFTQVEQAEEQYHPDQKTIRSEETLRESHSGKDLVAGIPGILSNQPNAAEARKDLEANDDSTGQESRVHATRNYEVDRTLSYTQHQVGKIKRLTASVLVNDIVITDPETGEATSRSWTEADLGSLRVLVQSAVGYQEVRGDSVSVVNRAFQKAVPVEFSETPFWAQNWFYSLLKQLLGALLLLFLMLGILRPLYRNLSQAGAVVKEQESLTLAKMAQHNEASFGRSDVPGIAGHSSLPALSGNKGYNQKVDSVKGMVDTDAERVAQVMKQWVSVDD